MVPGRFEGREDATRKSEGEVEGERPGKGEDAQGAARKAGFVSGGKQGTREKRRELSSPRKNKGNQTFVERKSRPTDHAGYTCHVWEGTSNQRAPVPQGPLPLAAYTRGVRGTLQPAGEVPSCVVERLKLLPGQRGSRCC